MEKERALAELLEVYMLPATCAEYKLGRLTTRRISGFCASEWVCLCITFRLVIVVGFVNIPCHGSDVHFGRLSGVEVLPIHMVSADI